MTNAAATDGVEIEVDQLVSIIGRYLGGGNAEVLAAQALVDSEAAHDPGFGLELLAESVGLRAAPVVEQADLVGRLDASECFGPTAVAAATIHAVDAASRDGIGMVRATSVGRLGRLAPYARWGAGRGVVTWVVADAPPAVAPHGGNAAVLGTNPIAIAAPGQPVLVADFATSAATEMARRDDSHLLAPRGGLIGTLVSLMVAVLTGGVSGRRPTRAAGRTVAVLALRPDDIEETSAWLDRLASDFVASGARLPGRRVEACSGAPTMRVDLERCGPVAAEVATYANNARRSGSDRT